MEGKRSIGLTGDWDGRINRRTLLRTGGSAAAGLFVLGRTVPVKAVPPFAGDPFSLGVAPRATRRRTGWCSGHAWRRRRWRGAAS